MVPSTDIFGNTYPDSGGAGSASRVADMLQDMASRNMAAPRFAIKDDGKTNGDLPDGKGLVLNDDWNQWLTGPYMMRAEWLQSIIDPRRDMDKECGYPFAIIPKQYRY